jgi:hypothetical protein
VLDSVSLAKAVSGSDSTVESIVTITVPAFYFVSRVVGRRKHLGGRVQALVEQAMVAAP